MTATLASVPAGTWTIGTPRLLAGLDRYATIDHAAHLAVRGPLPYADRPRLTALLEDVALSGRGGAGFPFAAKLRAMPRGHGTVIVNGSESEPASFKDRTLLRRAPHLVLDGALAVAAAIGARHVKVAVHDTAAALAVRRAIGERSDCRRVRVAQVSGGFVGGEARALLRGLSGGPALPPGRRVHLTQNGTLLSNVETYAHIAVALRLGPHRFRESGTHAEPGTTLLTVGGAVERPGVVEVPLGTPLGIVLSAASAAPPQAVVVGGYHGTWQALQPDLQLCHANGLGAGVISVLDDSTCAMGELARVAGWLAAQSARQCGPCRFGLPALARDVAGVAAGHDVAAAFHHAHAVDGRGACHHPDGAVRFVTSGLRLLREETVRHRTAGGCGRSIRGQLVVPT
ncbi:MAG TPA: NADH-ubiquinone oxidoreductase-F iron-sulfur binding region domain-containing protein [Jatrophihabitantaceae bacterium]|jgi:NADH:ubiquinone oxidoreductase subunit F (NADH-binding)